MGNIDIIFIEMEGILSRVEKCRLYKGFGMIL